MDTPCLQVGGGLREQLLVPSVCPQQSPPLTAGPPLQEGKGPSFAFSLRNVWEQPPGTDKTETRL